MTEKFSWDPGNGVSKAVWLNGQINQAIMPAVAGLGTLADSGLTLAGLDARQRSERPAQVSFGGQDYLLGRMVSAYARPIENIDVSRFEVGAELKAMLLWSMAELGLTGVQTACVVGVPVYLLADKATAKATEAALSKWMVGRHEFSVDGQEMAAEILKVRAVAQPLGAWLDWGMNEAGSWTRGAAGRKAPVLVIDQGFNTLDLFAVEDGRPSSRFTAGDDLGMARAAENIRTLVQARHGVSLSLHGADARLQQHLAGDSTSIYVHGETVSIAAECEQALNSLAADVLNFIRERIKADAGRFRIILTGGGALALHSRITRQYPHAEMANQPQIANARGLAKLAVSGFLG